MKLLTVDDSVVIRKIIKNAAKSLNYEVEEASDGYVALEKIENLKNSLSIILLDWNMPGLNGLEVLKQIKSNKDLCQIPVMMVTTEGQRESIITAVLAGADNYLTKPFTIEDLKKKIFECLGRS